MTKNTTDTNQASELFELCKKVYELTGWNNQELLGGWIQDQFDGPENRGTFTTRDQKETILFKLICPLYTSDYLLGKLPAHFYGGTITMTAETDEGPTRYSFFYEDNYETAQVVHCKNVRLQGWDDTPLKALLKLTIALSEAGELK